MKKLAYFSLSMLCLQSVPSHAEEAANQPSIMEDIVSMKLVNLKNQFIVVEYNDKETIFHDKILEKEMKERGVLIPPALRDRFGGKSNVRMNDPEFQVAFKEVFCPNVFNPKNFEWTE
ncbi:MAG: hypothetical protein JSR93_00835 [Verrucomicrobia bacterium]|nr:hypothetical protein [Verrucomicrobiota bacterium]